jgi:hypothetical protein
LGDVFFWGASEEKIDVVEDEGIGEKRAIEQSSKACQQEGGKQFWVHGKTEIYSTV